jgi:hypothetical protein
LRREDRLIKIPIIKSVAGANLAIISDSDKSIYSEIEDEIKKRIREQARWLVKRGSSHPRE